MSHFTDDATYTAKTAWSQISLENFLECSTLEIDTSSHKKSNKTSFSSGIEAFLSLVSDKVYNLHSQSILYPKYLSLDIIIILSTARCSLYESYVGNDLSWERILFTSPSSLSLWSLSSWNEVVGQMFILYKCIFL